METAKPVSAGAFSDKLLTELNDGTLRANIQTKDNDTSALNASPHWAGPRKD